MPPARRLLLASALLLLATNARAAEAPEARASRQGADEAKGSAVAWVEERALDDAGILTEIRELVEEVEATDRNFTDDELEHLADLTCAFDRCAEGIFPDGSDLYVAPSPEMEEMFDLGEQRGRLNPRVGIRFGRGGPTAYVQGGIRGQCQQICQSTAVRYGGLSREVMCQRSTVRFLTPRTQTLLCA